MWRNPEQARVSHFLLWSWPSINHHLPCVIPENRIAPAGLFEGQDLGQENIHKSGTSRGKELANKCHIELSPSAVMLLLMLSSTPLPSAQSMLTSIWQTKRDFGIEPLNENTVTSSWIPLPPQNTDSRKEQAQTLQPESPKFETKLYHLHWVIHPTSLSLSLLHLQNKANKTDFEGSRPNKVIYVKHIHVYQQTCFWSLPAPSFCMTTCPSKCEVQTVLQHRPHSRESQRDGSNAHSNWRPDQAVL